MVDFRLYYESVHKFFKSEFDIILIFVMQYLIINLMLGNTIIINSFCQYYYFTIIIDQSEISFYISTKKLKVFSRIFCGIFFSVKVILFNFSWGQFEIF